MSTQATRGISPLVFALVVFSLLTSTAVIVFSMLRLSNSSGTNSGSVTSGNYESLSQKGTLKPEGLTNGVVFYAMPYDSPPNLEVSPGSRYLIARQDEFGFTWVDRAGLTGQGSAVIFALIPEAANLPRGAEPKFDPQQPELTWEAKGLRATAGTLAMKTFEQSGSFQSDFAQQGQVNFPIPYGSPPNVELSGFHKKTIIVESTATGFKWKNSGNAKEGWASEAGTVTWKSKGIRATQVPVK